MNTRNKFVLLCTALMIFIFAGCTEFDISVLENREGELVFSVSIDDYIDSCNRNYQRAYLPPSDQWSTEIHETSVHSDHETVLYIYSPDETVWSMPTVTVYVPPDSEYIQEITVNFDDHSYSYETYELFEEMCFYTLKVFFPDMDDGQIIELYQTLNALAFENVVKNEQGYDSDSVPCALYYKDGVGLYPYFAIGECLHLCIIPVTDETIDEFSRSGTEIYEIK